MAEATSLEKLISQGESRTVEFKAELPSDNQKWIKTILAFANGAGGKLVIGVNNKHEIKGLSKKTDLFTLRDLISDTIGQMCKPLIVPTIYAETIQGKQILVVEVYPGSSTPYHIASKDVKQGTYIRLDATTRKADEFAIDELILRNKKRFYDELPFTDLKVIPSDIKFLCDDLSKRAERKITKQDLINMQVLIKENNSIIASRAYGILLGKFDYTARIQCARFKGTNRVDFLDKKEFEGPLTEQVDKTYAFILEHLNKAIEIKGISHKEKYELPEKALRELVVNAVVHRNYMLSSSVQVAVYDDRVEITSPGSLYGTLTLEEALAGRSAIRNKVLARVFEKAKIIEGWGSGLKRITDLCKKIGIKPPEITELGEAIRINFYRQKIARKLPKKPPEIAQKLPRNCPEIAQKTYEAIKSNPKATIDELHKILNVSERTIKNHQALLKEVGLIERKGNDRIGSWIVKEEQ